MRKLDDARFELGEFRKPRVSRTSLRCYWRRPLGHTWEMKESRGKPVLRCTACGKVTRGPRGWVDKRDAPAGHHEWPGGGGGGEGPGGGGGGDGGY